MKKFSYYRPENITQAFEIADSYNGQVSYLAGGTDLLVKMKNYQIKSDALIDLKSINEINDEVVVSNTEIRIGSLCLMSKIEANETINHFFPALAEAAASIGSVQIRNRATIGGNICNASPAADTLPPLFIYDAAIEIIGKNNKKRIVPIRDFILGPGEKAIGPNELVSSIIIPIPLVFQSACFDRLSRRRGVDLATINICCQVNENDIVRFAIGAAAPTPFIVEDTSGLLANAKTTDEQKNKVLKDLMGAASPIDDVRASKNYRQAMLVVLAKRVLIRAINEIKLRREVS